MSARSATPALLDTCGEAATRGGRRKSGRAINSTAHVATRCLCWAVNEGRVGLLFAPRKRVFKRVAVASPSGATSRPHRINSAHNLQLNNNAESAR